MISLRKLGLLLIQRKREIIVAVKKKRDLKVVKLFKNKKVFLCMKQSVQKPGV